jgi:integrase
MPGGMSGRSMRQDARLANSGDVAMGRCAARTSVPCSQTWLLLAFAGPLGREGQALGSSAVREMVKVVAKRAGLRHVAPHQLRHGFGQEAAADMPPDLLQRLLGHARIESQDAYRQTSDEAVAAAVLRLDNARQERIDNR